jgi:hypothetical protein
MHLCFHGCVLLNSGSAVQQISHTPTPPFSGYADYTLFSYTVSCSGYMKGGCSFIRCWLRPSLSLFRNLPDCPAKSSIASSSAVIFFASSLSLSSTS